MQKIAIVSALGIGDGLLSMVIANNLQRNGFKPTTFNNHLIQLREWFPGFAIESFPHNLKVFQQYDKIISTDGAPLFKLNHQLDDKYHVFFEHDFDRNRTVLENFMKICRNFFAIENVTSQNGITIPKELQFRKHIRRVILHPMSTSATKNWLPEKFIKLARKLQKKQYIPVFVVCPAEREQWHKLLPPDFSLPLFSTLSHLAEVIFESGYMIGNDSGVGHLAANLGIPTLSLFARKSVANLWRPGWGKGQIVLPTFQLPGARLRTRYWQRFLTVNKVYSKFEELLQQ